MSTRVSSPLKWTGGKARIAQKIIQAFPASTTYDVFCEVFAGSASILFAKHPGNHLEVINDRNARLINFWMAVREDAECLQWKLKTLPYSEVLFKRYRESLDSGEQLEMVEEAARWYYVNRGTIAGHIDSSKGWQYTAPRSRTLNAIPSEGKSYQNAVSLLTVISSRLANVQIHDWSYERVIEKYQSDRTFLYLDPPYLDSETYYAVDGTPPFTSDDHRHLAALLNQTPAKVALSYYDHPLLSELYPADKWRRVSWQTNKELSRMNSGLQKSCEVLLMNYAAAATIWDEVSA